MTDTNPMQTIKRLERELREFIYAEKVMIAAGHVTEETVRMAHEIVREAQGDD